MKLNFQYNFRIGPEVAWALAIAFGVPFLQAAATFTGFATLTPDFWDGVFAAAIRGLGGAALALVTGGGFQKPGVPKDNAEEINETLPAPYWDGMNESSDD